jgi:D-alanine-D-alanine ligase
MAGIDISDFTVGILEGGVSEEREISLLSGEQVFLSLVRQNIKALRLDINTRDKRFIKDILYQNKVDIAFIALHGEFGEDGTIQGILEEENFPYTGSGPRASYLAMNKILSKRIFLKRNIPTPNFCVLEKGEAVPSNLSYPVVVKPYFSGSSLGVSIVRRPQDLEGALYKAYQLGRKVILEDYIGGRELTVGILGNRPLGVVEIIPKNGYFDFSTKYTEGLADFVAPARLDKGLYKRVQKLALDAHNSLGCRDFSRVDIKLSKEGMPFVLEINSIPGLTSHSLLPLSAKCLGIDFDTLIKEMIYLATNRLKIRVGN